MKNRAFTLMEIVIVVIIIGVLAIVGLINFDEFLQLGRERDAVTQLRAMATALKVYEMRAKEFPDGGNDLSDVDDINTTLGLSIMEHGITYSCIFVGTAEYDCRAISGAHGWILRIAFSGGSHEDAHCHNVKDCPTCKSCADCDIGDNSDDDYCY